MLKRAFITMMYLGGAMILQESLRYPYTTQIISFLIFWVSQLI